MNWMFSASTREREPGQSMTPRPAVHLENAMKIKCSRPAIGHDEAKRLMHLMGYCGFSRLRITGKRLAWKVLGDATAQQLAKFAGIEARDQMDKERKDAAK